MQPAVDSIQHLADSMQCFALIPYNLMVDSIHAYGVIVTRSLPCERSEPLTPEKHTACVDIFGFAKFDICYAFDIFPYGKFDIFSLCENVSYILHPTPYILFYN